MVSEEGKARFKWQDACGVVGVIVAVATMTDMPIALRLICFSSCAICLPISFSSHKNWPLWIRWLSSAAVVAIMGYVGWIAWASSRPKIVKDVYIEWPQPAPMESGTSLSEHQLDAVAKNEGVQVPGKYIYNPAIGATLPSGMDTLSVEFTPVDQTKYKSAKQTLTVFVRDNASLSRPAPGSKPPPHQQGGSSPSAPAPAPPPSTVNSAPDGFAVSGGTLDHPTVNHYDAPPKEDEDVTLLHNAEKLYSSIEGWQLATEKDRDAQIAQVHITEANRSPEAQENTVNWIRSYWWKEHLQDYQQTYSSDLIKYRRDMLAIAPEAGAENYGFDWANPEVNGEITGIISAFRATTAIYRIKLRRIGKLTGPMTLDEQMQTLTYENRFKQQ